MESSIVSAAKEDPSASPALPFWRRAVRVILFNLVLWSVLCTLGALTSLNDDLAGGFQGSFWLIWRAWAGSALAWASMSAIFYACFTRWPKLVSDAKHILAGYALTLFVLLPLQLAYLLKLYLREGGPGLTWESIEAQIEAINDFGSFSRLASVSAVYFAVVAVKIWQQSQQRAKVLAQTQADSFALRLALERQRGLALRAQLEPHFVFNALNAISALVRSDNKNAALTGIHELSELLRYALAAGEHKWVKFEQELDFIEDYLALQRLRYGARLRVVIDGVDPQVLDCDCPPLLLQPLVENALRHDLDRHEQASDIRLRFSCHEANICINVSNLLLEGVAENPGTGLGLRNTQERLQLAYGGSATIKTGAAGGRFQVDICMPMYAPE